MPTLFLACEQKLMPCKMAEESISKFQNFLFLQLNFHILDFWWPWNQYLSFRTFLIFFVSIKFSYLCKSSMKYKALKTFESNLDLQQSLLTKKKIFGKNWKICCQNNIACNCKLLEMPKFYIKSYSKNYVEIPKVFSALKDFWKSRHGRLSFKIYIL